MPLITGGKMATPSPTEAPITQPSTCSFEGENCPCPNKCLDEDQIFSAMDGPPECTIEWEISSMCLEMRENDSRSCTVDGYGYYCNENGSIEKSGSYTRSPTFPPTSPEEEGCIQILLGDSDYMENESQFRTCLCEYLDHVVPQSYFSVAFDFCDQWDNISSVQFLPGGIKGLESLGDNGVYDLQLDLRFLTKPVKEISSELNETIKQSPPTCATQGLSRPTFVQVCSPVEPVCPPEPEKSIPLTLLCCMLFLFIMFARRK